MSTLTRGDRLPNHLQREVLAAYVHRWTHENAQRSYNGHSAGSPSQSHPQPFQWISQREGVALDMQDNPSMNGKRTTKEADMVFNGDTLGDCELCGMERRLESGYCFDCLDRKQANVATWEEIVKLELRVLELEARFRHTHVNNGSDDSCAVCGFDLRDAVHKRISVIA